MISVPINSACVHVKRFRLKLVIGWVLFQRSSKLLVLANWSSLASTVVVSHHLGQSQEAPDLSYNGDEPWPAWVDQHAGTSRGLHGWTNGNEPWPTWVDTTSRSSTKIVSLMPT